MLSKNIFNFFVHSMILIDICSFFKRNFCTFVFFSIERPNECLSFLFVDSAASAERFVDGSLNGQHYSFS